MSITVEGSVRDGKIELVDGPDLVDGQRVRLVIEPRSVPILAIPDEGLVHTPLEDPILIEVLGEIRERRPPLPPSPTGPGRSSSAGVLTRDPTWDEDLESVIEARKSDTHRGLGE